MRLEFKILRGKDYRGDAAFDEIKIHSGLCTSYFNRKIRIFSFVF